MPPAKEEPVMNVVFAVGFFSTVVIRIGLIWRLVLEGRSRQIVDLCMNYVAEEEALTQILCSLLIWFVFFLSL